jgi:hypothetical protein
MRWFATWPVTPDLDLRSGDDLAAAPAKTAFIDRFPRVKNIQPAEGLQSLLRRQIERFPFHEPSLFGGVATDYQAVNK